MIDDAVNHLAEVQNRPAWQEMPQTVRDYFRTSAPAGPKPLRDVYSELRENLVPYSMGNIHPRFWGWYMGASNFTGAMADFLAAIDGSNLGAATRHPP